MMPIEPLYLNGEWLTLDEAQISPFDRGFLFADGCYEVMPIYHQKIFRLADHINRLAYSLSELDIENPFTSSEWENLFLRLVSQGGTRFDKSYIYLQVTRGVMKNRNHTIGEKLRPTIFAYLEPAELHLRTALPEPIRARLVEDYRWQRGDIKAISLLGSVLERNRALQQGWDDCIFYRGQHVLETSASNIFIVDKGVVKTPPLSNLLLNGITRLVLLELLERHKIRFEVSTITIGCLKNASEVWMASSVKELVPIVNIDDHIVGEGQVGPVLQKIGQHWRQYIREAS